jgi:regulator of RNase E activity RraA
MGARRRGRPAETHTRHTCQHREVYCHSTTAKQGPGVHWPWGVDEVIARGGMAVRPGDVVVGDDDGVVVVPAPLVDEIIQIAAEREAVEHVIKKELERHPASPGRYYPFNDATWKLYEEYKRRGEA